MTEEQRASYWSAGYVFPIPALSPDEVHYFRTCVDTLLARHGWPLDPRQRHKPHLLSRWVNDLGRHARILDAVEDLLGADLLLLNSWFFIKPAHDGAEIAWHRDSFYGLVDHDEGVTAWVALTDSTRANGCVRFADATHRDPAENGNKLLRGENVDPRSEWTITEALVPAGHLSLHHVRAAHCSGPNATDEPRVAIALRYIAAHSAPRRPGAQASAVRGTHGGGFLLEPKPREDDDPAVLAWHARSFRRHSLGIIRQALRQPRSLGSLVRPLFLPANLRAAVSNTRQTLRTRRARIVAETAHTNGDLFFPHVGRDEAGGMEASSVAPLPWRAGREARDQRERWEMVARSWPDLYAAASTQYYRRCEIALVERYLGEARGKSVLKLDLWNEAVNTRLLQWIESRGAHVFGIDLSSVTAVRARRNFAREKRNGHFAQGDIRSLPFAESCFDFVYTMGTIEHVREYELAIREVRRVLKPGGTAVIGVPHKWDPFLRPLVVRVLERFNLYPYSPERAFGASELRAVVERNGLKVEQRTGLLFVPGVVRLADLFLHVRGLPMERLTAAATRPFEYAELRWEWARRLGYLVAVVARK